MYKSIYLLHILKLNWRCGYFTGKVLEVNVLTDGQCTLPVNQLSDPA